MGKTPTIKAAFIAATLLAACGGGSEDGTDTGADVAPDSVDSGVDTQPDADVTSDADVASDADVDASCDDTDGDGVCDEDDICADGDDTVDADEDGVPDACDVCEDGDDAEDEDEDGVPDACDACPGSDDSEDADGDGVPDDCDLCEGFDDADDTDEDGIPNACDICDGDDSADADGDGVPDACDICDGDDALDADLDEVPDACDACDGGDDRLDADADGVPDDCDVCADADDTMDADSDGVPDGCDVCPDADDGLDADADGVPDGCDVCAGGPDDVDTDGDGVADFCDLCPLDNPDDTDGDGVCESNDVCAGGDDGVDEDGDGVADFCDVCPLDNPDDSDGDGVCDSADVCAGGDDGVDGDGDGVPDFCDICPLDNPDDSDGDEVCDSDDLCEGEDDRLDADGDTVPDACDVCAGDDTLDADADGVPDACDNCVDEPNADQLDSDGTYAFAVERVDWAPRTSPATDAEPGDDSVTEVELGFTFNFAGRDVTTVWISSNGFIHTDADVADALEDGCCAGDELGVDDSTNGIIAGLWTDLDPGSETAGLFYETQGTAPNREFVVSWEDVLHFDGGDAQSFQIVLGEAGYVEVHCEFCDAPSGGKGEGPGSSGETQGVQAEADLFSTVPGRNSSDWVAIEDGVRFTWEFAPDGVGDACDECPDDPGNDEDGDGVCALDDVCEGFDDLADADLDTVPDGCDICADADDLLDSDSDGVPDGCDLCEGSNDARDSDADGVPDGCDVCRDFDDTIDADGDGVPDGCDVCPDADDTLDTDRDGVPDGCDACAGFDDALDEDADGTPDACDDDCPTEDLEGLVLPVVVCTPSIGEAGGCSATHDGDRGSRWSTSEDSAPYWFQYDMGASVSASVLRYQTDWHTKAPDEFEIWVSDSPTSTPDTDATLVYAGEGVPAPAGNLSNRIDQTYPFDEATGRYWYFRVVSTQTPGFLILFEVEFLTGVTCGSECTIDTDLDGIFDCYDIEAGDLVINEAMVTPAAVSDADGEWFELYNASDRDLRLAGLTASDADGESFRFEDVLIESGGYVVVTANENHRDNGGVRDMPFAYGSAFSFDEVDEIILTGPADNEVDRVEWDETWPITSGAALDFGADPLTDDNNDPANWCSVLLATYGDGDLGTPGAENEGCEIEASFPSPDDTPTIASGPNLWNAGDQYEGTRSYSTPITVGALRIVLPLTNNFLTCDTQDHDVILNGTVVGEFSAAEGMDMIDVEIPVDPTITADFFTIIYRTKETVLDGCGSVGFDIEASSLELVFE